MGYRSNGSYVGGWFGGACGTGNPYYLMCSDCRDKYLGARAPHKVTSDFSVSAENNLEGKRIC